jgi:hypothetical protein
VQGIHASIEAARRFSIPPHEYVVYCSVRDECALSRWKSKLRSAGIDFCAFREPDLENQLTSLATEPVFGENRRLFKSLNLVKGE